MAILAFFVVEGEAIRGKNIFASLFAIVTRYVAIRHSNE